MAMPKRRPPASPKAGASPAKAKFHWASGFGETGEKLSMLIVVATLGFHKFGPDGLAKSITNKALFINYGDGNGKFSSGSADMYFVMFAVMALTSLRVLVNNLVFAPMARSLGVNEKKVCDKYAF